MLSQLADYHVHTPLCHHATGWPVEYARRAVDLGLGELGFADHNPMAEQFDEWRMHRDDLPRYLDEVERARAEFPQLTIRLGLECDFIAGREAWIEELAGLANWDFFIGSVHYIPEGWDIDNPKHLRRHMNNADEIWASYWQTYERAIRSGLYDFVGHPDLPKKFGYRPEGDLRRFYEPSIAAMAECGVAFEINTSGLRKECRELYPAPEFVALACEAGVPLLINSDSHDPGELTAGFAEGVALAKAAGYAKTARFSRREISFVPLP